MHRTPDEAWQTFITELSWWIGEHGTAYVPQNATSREVDGEPYRLGGAVARRRWEHGRGALTAHQVRQLERLPGWSWDGTALRAEANWARDLARVREHFDRTGSLEGLDPVDPGAARWLRRQVAAEAAGTLRHDRRKQLNEIPGALEPRSVPTTRVARFVAAVNAWIGEKEGRTAANIRQRTTQTLNGQVVRIGRDATAHRRRYADGKLSPATIAEIEKLPGWTWTKTTADDDAEHKDD